MSMTADIWQSIQDVGSVALNRSLSNWADTELMKLNGGTQFAQAQQKAITNVAETDNGVKAKAVEATEVVPFYKKKSVQIAGGAVVLVAVAWALTKKKRGR